MKNTNIISELHNYGNKETKMKYEIKAFNCLLCDNKIEYWNGMGCEKCIPILKKIIKKELAKQKQ